MTTIENGNGRCTLINVFTVAPDKQTALFESLKEATEHVMSKFPGYISANIHMGDDGKTVTTYAQWASLQEYQNVLANPKALVHMKQAAEIATRFSPTTYNTIWSHGSND